MINPLKILARKTARVTGLENLIVKIKSGRAKGLKWTLLPYSMYWRGKTEKVMDQAVESISKKNFQNIWDLGAHFGFYSLVFRKCFPEAKIYSFEPEPYSFKKLLFHIKINGFGDKIKPLNLAVGERDRKSYLDLGRGKGRSVAKISSRRKVRGDVLISVRKLDELVEKGKINYPDLIKVDVEGFGGKAIKGAKNSITKKRPVIIVSFHNKKEIEETKEILRPIGYGILSNGLLSKKWPKKMPSTVVLATEKYS